LRERAVVALGGGAIVNPDTQRDLAELRVALVTVSEEAVASRILGSSRPLVSGVEGWSKLVEGRREIYERLATRVWDTSNQPIDHVASEMAAWITDQIPEETPAEGTE
jgi:shikimate kinase